MTDLRLIECVPNFSEGCDMTIIKQITDEIESVGGVKLLDVDPGRATNRTVVTFVGAPDQVVEAALLAIKKAGSLIDMSQHKGEHPRMGSTDVCPLIPIANISMEETAEYAHKLAKRVGEETSIPIFMYEAAATEEKRQNLASVRAGEYEGMEKKLSLPEWKPDYGPAIFNAKTGTTAIGARDFLVAYNVNLNTSSVRRANSIAFDVRENGRLKREAGKLNGKVLTDANGNQLREPGMCKSVKAIGWYIEEYGLAQISMNLTNIEDTPLHVAFEACRKSANTRGMRVTGSELVGLVPKKVMIDAGKYFLELQERSVGISDEEIIHIAIKSLGLDELGPFDYKKKIIEYLLEEDGAFPLLNKNLREFTEETASESPAPGGGSISAYVGSLGIALGNMVANLSAHKRGWDDKWAYFSAAAEKGKAIQEKILRLVDEDTKAFNKIMDAIRLPKSTQEDKDKRQKAISDATKNAINVPLDVMETCHSAYEVLMDMAEAGNPNSISDVGVGALCIHTAIEGAFLNVKINCTDFDAPDFVKESLDRGYKIVKSSEEQKKSILEIVEEKI